LDQAQATLLEAQEAMNAMSRDRRKRDLTKAFEAEEPLPLLPVFS
jgi:hypothetical protein